MRFFDAHCDTISKILDDGADFSAPSSMPEAGGGGASRAAAEPRQGSQGATTPSGPDRRLHVTLPGMRAAGMRAQVFACWMWAEKYPGDAYEAGLEKVAAVRALCAEHPADLFFATTGAEVAAACSAEDPGGIAVIASLEGADPLLDDARNLRVFHDAGVRLVTIAWGDNAFAGTVFGGGSGLTAAGRDLVEYCEELGVVVDVSHLSDAAFVDVCAVAKAPFVASHSNCRTLCPNGRNLTDEMIRVLGDRGGVMGINLGSSFLSAEFYRSSKSLQAEFFRSVAAGEKTVDEAGAVSAAAQAALPRPALELVVDHVRRAINIGGEDCVALGGDLDGVDNLPRGMDGIEDYPRMAQLLAAGGLSTEQVEKVCYRNLARLFSDILR